MKNQPVHFISGDLHSLATSVALVARLFATRSENLRRLRVASDGASNIVPGLVAWLDHTIGWEQDRRAGYHYPLRGPTEMIGNDELAGSIAAIEMLAIRFRDDMQIAALLDMFSIIVSLGGPMNTQRRRHDDNKATA